MPHYKHKTKSGTSGPIIGRQPKGLGRRGSSTPGSVKGENCQADSKARTFCKRNRSYKYEGYDQWFLKTRTHT